MNKESDDKLKEFTEHEAIATFAGGCFWCMVPPFEKLEGVKKVISGYTGGHVDRPTYEQVCAGGTGHLEAIQVTFDSTKITYEKLLEVYWQQIDPTDAEGQFVDKGESYKTAIFYHNEEQRKSAEASKGRLQESDLFRKGIATQILPAAKFYPAEDYHQAYYKKNPVRYKTYRFSSGRDQFLEKTWAPKKPK